MYNYDVGTQNILPKYSSIIILGVGGSFLLFEHKMNNRQNEYQDCKDKSNTTFLNYNTFNPLDKVHIS